MSMSQVTVPCPSCGQHLVVATHDLRAHIACPRCGANGVAAHLIPATTPLTAIPVGGVPAAPTPNIYVQPVFASPSAVAAPPIAVTHAGAPPPSAALPVGQRAWRRTSRALWVVAKAAARVDSVFAGRRFLCMSVLAFALGLANLWSPIAYALLLPILPWLLWISALAYLGSLREPDGKWRFGIVFERLLSGISQSFQSIDELGEKPAAEWMREFSGVFLGGATFIAALAPLTKLVLPRDDWATADGASVLSIAIVAVAGGLRVLRWLQGSRGEGRLVKAATPVLSSTEVFALDLRDASSSQIAALPEDTVRRLATEIASWRPRSCEKECDFEISLARFLRRRFPTSDVLAQQTFPWEYGTLRFDLLIDGAIVLELKCALGAANEQRAFGQLQDYRAFWKKGPVVLLLCVPSDEFRASRLARMRDVGGNGGPVYVLGAGYRG